MLLARRVPDELDLADAVVSERLQDRAPTFGDPRYLLADHETSRAEALRVLLELSPYEGSADVAVGRDVRAERVEPARGDVDDLLGDAGEIRRLACEAHELGGVLGTEHLHAEAVVEASLFRGLHDRRVADVLRGRLQIVERVGLRDRDAEMVRVGIQAALVEDRIDHRELAEGDPVARLEL